MNNFSEQLYDKKNDDVYENVKKNFKQSFDNNNDDFERRSNSVYHKGNNFVKSLNSEKEFFSEAPPKCRVFCK